MAFRPLSLFTGIWVILLMGFHSEMLKFSGIRSKPVITGAKVLPDWEGRFTVYSISPAGSAHGQLKRAGDIVRIHRCLLNDGG